MAIGLKAPGYYIQGEGELDKLGKYVKKIRDDVFGVAVSQQ